MGPKRKPVVKQQSRVAIGVGKLRTKTQTCSNYVIKDAHWRLCKLRAGLGCFNYWPRMLCARQNGYILAKKRSIDTLETGTRTISNQLFCSGTARPATRLCTATFLYKHSLTYTISSSYTHRLNSTMMELTTRLQR